MVSAYPCISQLVNKEHMTALLGSVQTDTEYCDGLLRQIIAAALLPTIKLSVGGSTGASPPAAPPGVWMLKVGGVNNGLGVAIVADGDVGAAIHHIITHAPLPPAAGLPSYLLQRYVTDPLLLRGRKFHARVNVLAGACVHTGIPGSRSERMLNAFDCSWCLGRLRTSGCHLSRGIRTVCNGRLGQ
jgi:hypothetical protein